MTYVQHKKLNSKAFINNRLMRKNSHQFLFPKNRKKSKNLLNRFLSKLLLAFNNNPRKRDNLAIQNENYL